MRDLLVLGAGGQGREAVLVAEAMNRVRPTWNVLGFVERDGAAVGTTVGRHRVVCRDADVGAMDAALVVAVGDPQAVSRAVKRLGDLPASRFANLVHPSVSLEGDPLTWGVGNVVAAGTIFTTEVRIGSWNYVNLACTVSHDVVIGDCCVVNPGARLSGGVRIGSRCLIGAGACILQGRTVGDDARVGAGAVVTHDVAPGTTVVGVPARPLRRGG